MSRVSNSQLYYTCPNSCFFRRFPAALFCKLFDIWDLGIGICFGFRVLNFEFGCGQRPRWGRGERARRAAGKAAPGRRTYTIPDLPTGGGGQPPKGLDPPPTVDKSDGPGSTFSTIVGILVGQAVGIVQARRREGHAAPSHEDPLEMSPRRRCHEAKRRDQTMCREHRYKYRPALWPPAWTSTSAP